MESNYSARAGDALAAPEGGQALNGAGDAVFHLVVQADQHVVRTVI
jgi:hypothetical protein